MRIYLYILAGLTSALIGWNLGEFFNSDLGILPNMPEIVIFPCVAASLATGMVLNEIFLSSPTRPKLNFRSAPLPVGIAAVLGLVSGLFAGILSQVLFLTGLGLPAFLVRLLGWLCIGSSVGFAEGFTWRWRSIEAGNSKRFWNRFITSIVAGSVASLLAALLFELVGAGSDSISSLQDPLGFSILGILLGLAFSLTISPSYMVALRAGTGFEFFGRDNPSTYISKIKLGVLEFVSPGDSATEIEEGLSIRLPASGQVMIGSAADADIQIPQLPDHAAQIQLKDRESVITALQGDVEVGGDRVPPNGSKMLKHNHILTFRVDPDSQYNDDDAHSQGLYRFVYYNRFLDPQG